MKSFILLILMIDNSGNEHIDRVNNITYQDKLYCLVDKAIIYNDKAIYSKDSIIESDDHVTKSIKYFCADKLLYQVK